MHNSKRRLIRADILACALVFVALAVQGSYIIGPSAAIFPSTTVPGFVQTAEAHTAATPTNLSVSFGALPKLGDVVIVAVDTGAGSIATNLSASVTDNQGNTYSRMVAQPFTGNTTGVTGLWCGAVTISGGTYTVTVTSASNVQVGIMILEYGNTTCNGDKMAGAASGTSPYNCGSVTTQNAKDLLLTFLFNPAAAGTITYTAPTNFTIRQSQTVAANGQTMAIAEQVVNATATYTPTFTASQNLANSECITAAILSR